MHHFFITLSGHLTFALGCLFLWFTVVVNNEIKEFFGVVGNAEMNAYDLYRLKRAKRLKVILLLIGVFMLFLSFLN